MKISNLIIILLSTLFAHAQQNDSLTRLKKITDSVLTSENLLKLDGTPTTFYSEGFEIRSLTIQNLMRRCIQFYQTAFPEKRFSATVYVLNKSDWSKPLFEFPYGMPFYSDSRNILVIAAEKNALRRLTGLPDDPIASDSVLSDIDYQPLHELGHHFFFTLYKIDKEKWLNEFLATYFLICFLKDKNLEPDLEAKTKADYPVAHRSLEDFQRLYGGVGPSNYHWYQQKFARLGFILYPAFRLELIRRVLQNYGPGGKNLDGIALLQSMAPAEMKAWLAEMQ